MKHSALNGFVLGVTAAAVGLLVALPADGLFDRPLVLALLAATAAVAGLRPIRFSSQGNELTATHPVVLCALAGLGVIPAVITAICGVVASTLVRRRSSRPIQVLFNLGDVVICTAAAWGAFVLLGGREGGTGTLLVSLLGATAAYYLVNTGLVAAAVSLDRGRPLVATWLGSFRWTAASYLTVVTVAFAMLVALEHIGLAGVALGLPPIWLMTRFYREHHARLGEKQHRIEEVERLNGDLRDKVDELQEALDHVERLQGLLPICMHCKNVRDDQDTWRRIESYLAEHSGLQFTHSLCQDCRSKHYPEVPIDQPERV